MLSKSMYKNVRGPRESSLAISSRMDKNKIVVYLLNGIIKKARIIRSNYKQFKYYKIQKQAKSNLQYQKSGRGYSCGWK